jgi:hypothetical protein
MARRSPAWYPRFVSATRAEAQLQGEGDAALNRRSSTTVATNDRVPSGDRLTVEERLQGRVTGRRFTLCEPRTCKTQFEKLASIGDCLDLIRLLIVLFTPCRERGVVGIDEGWCEGAAGHITINVNAKNARPCAALRPDVLEYFVAKDESVCS